MANKILRFRREVQDYLGISGFPDGEKEDIQSKKLILRAAISNLITVGAFVPLFWFLELRLWFYLGIIYCLFFLLIALLFIWLQRGLKWFSLAMQLFFLSFSFFNVLATGGIMHSGGAVFIGLGAVSLMIGRGWIKRTNLMLGLYLLTIFLELMLEPYLSPLMVLPEHLNTVFFIIHFSIVIVVLISYMQIASKMEQQLHELENEKWKALNAAKTTFFTNISHEFRTPLTVILGMVEQILDNPKRWYSEGLDMIRRNGEELLHMVTQILDLSKLDEAVLPVKFLKGDVIPHIRYAVDSVKSLATIKQIELHFDSKVDVLHMDYDEDKLQRIISNILSNAIRHTGPGGSIRVCIDGIIEDKTSLELGNNSYGHLQIKIIDTGSGIPAKNLPRIFERFYKGGFESASSSKGTGLGLAIVKELVELLGGQVTVSSQLGRGTKFTVNLPVNQMVVPGMESTADPDEKTIEPNLTGPFTQHKEQPLILVVEDSRDVVQYLRSILSDQYRILMAYDGQSGIDLAKEKLPDLIVSDVMMPKKNGFELCQTLKTDIRTSHIPIILLTARVDAESRLEGFRTGADAYMPKPFTKRELLIRIQRQIALRKTLQQKYAAMAFTFSNLEKPKDVDESFLADLSNVLKENYQNADFDVSAFCREIGMSRSQLHKKLHSLTGKSTTEIIRSFRLQMARELITSTKRTIAQIAYETGFNDPAYFSRVFAQEFDGPPSELRSRKIEQVQNR